MSIQISEPKFLSSVESAVFADARLLGPFSTRRGPLALELNALPLAFAAEAAALGFGLYEFMNIRRPGDVLRYVRLVIKSEPDAAARRLSDRLKSHARRSESGDAPVGGLPFVVFDNALWQPERDCYDEDDDEYVHAWVQFRKSSYWRDLCIEFLTLVRHLQHRLRAEAVDLTQHELSLLDAQLHRRDFWPSVDSQETVDPGQLRAISIPPDLFEAFVSLVSDPDVRSVSCCWKDFQIWRTLAREQRRRAEEQGLPPKEALFLSGPDSGLYDVPIADWAAEVHIPYEGYLGGDVFVIPHWLKFYAESAERLQSVRAGLNGRAGKHVISPRFLGSFAHESHRQFGEWTVYSPN